ncbi:hypothetical protein OAJ22_00755 [Acidimicrobiaceae bacterium]|jgi:hypothetical protein|nr:hypothetical protein [Acidimicrobiaceae bacterium]|tara:strand:+ start:231 stop:665 length:435 start_codon:yes stop_codon:yes gene_type:complete
MILKAILWPIKKVLLFPIKIVFYSTLLFIVGILFFQYRADYDVDVSPLSVAEYENCINVIDDYDLTINLLSEYVEKLDSQQQSFLYSYLPDSFGVLTTPQEITEDDFQNVRTFLKNYLQAGRFPGFGGKALAPQAASLCRDGLS